MGHRGPGVNSNCLELRNCLYKSWFTHKLAFARVTYVESAESPSRILESLT